MSLYLELKQKNDVIKEKEEENASLTKELETLKKQIEDDKSSIMSTQPVHDNDQLTLGKI